MSSWVISYHIDFSLDDGTLVTRSDMRTVDDQSLETDEQARAWLVNRYEKSNDPLVDMTGLFVGITNEELVIDDVILHVPIG
jgi:hypothetical protein